MVPCDLGRWTCSAPTGRSCATAASRPTGTSRKRYIDELTLAAPPPPQLGYSHARRVGAARGTWLSWPHKEASWPGKFEPVPGIFARHGAAPRAARGGAHQRARRRRWKRRRAALLVARHATSAERLLPPLSHQRRLVPRPRPDLRAARHAGAARSRRSSTGATTPGAASIRPFDLDDVDPDAGSARSSAFRCSIRAS